MYNSTDCLDFTALPIWLLNTFLYCSFCLLSSGLELFKQCGQRLPKPWAIVAHVLFTLCPHFGHKAKKVL